MPEDKIRGEAPKISKWILRRPDQVTVAGLVLLALMIIAARSLYYAMNGTPLVTVDVNSPVPMNYSIDINTAEVPELLSLPRIGVNLASRIVESRKKNGPYRSLEDLKRVHGIGDLMLKNLRPYLKPIEADK